MWWVWLFLVLGAIISVTLLIALQRRVHWRHRLRDELREEPREPVDGPPRPVAG